MPLEGTLLLPRLHHYSLLPLHHRMKIYTKTGDSGTSALYNGQRRSKDDLAFNALGDIDELNSSIGLARDLTRTYLPNKIPQLLSQLEVIQSRLLDCGSAVATPKETSSTKKVRSYHI
jgi:cob(I)alamin adenosyltransferase